VSLSKKGEELGKPNPTLDHIKKIFSDIYSDLNTNGMMNCGVAENTLMYRELLDYFHKNFQLDPIDLTYGDALNGSNRLSSALGGYFQTYFNPVTPVEPDHIITGTGLSAVVDQLCEKLCDPEDTMLLSTPYYNGFDGDFQMRNGVLVTPVDFPANVDPAGPGAIQCYKDVCAKAKSEKKAGRPRAIMLCSPHNPLGFIYSKEMLIEYCNLAEEEDLHLIVDEIYAESVFASKDIPEPRRFVSILSIDVAKETKCDPARVHCLYGMSKDFGANGLRMGVMVSQHNPALIRAILSTSILMKVSSPADSIWSTMLNDKEFLPYYLKENKKRLGQAYDSVTEVLKKYQVPYNAASAGVFLWVDFSAYLPTHGDDGNALKMEDRQSALATKFLQKHKLFVAPGAQYHSKEPGWFRFTFALRQDFLQIALDRLEEALAEENRTI